MQVGDPGFVINVAVGIAPVYSVLVVADSTCVTAACEQFFGFGPVIAGLCYLRSKGSGDNQRYEKSVTHDQAARSCFLSFASSSSCVKGLLRKSLAPAVNVASSRGPCLRVDIMMMGVK